MTRRKKTKYVHEGQYVAEVDVELIEDETEWSPYLSVDDTYYCCVTKKVNPLIYKETLYIS